MEFPGAVYHLTSRGNARQKVFFTDADRELFLSTRWRDAVQLVLEANRTLAEEDLRDKSVIREQFAQIS